jgi:general stress protein 26
MPEHLAPLVFNLLGASTGEGMDDLITQCWDLIQSQEQCVLATLGPAGPHCSLMSHLAEAHAGVIYLITRADTAKFRNIVNDPRVSLLVDQRNASPGKALTISGRCAPLAQGPERKRLLADFGQKHPGLRPILDAPDCRVLAVRVERFQYLDGVEGARSLDL